MTGHDHLHRRHPRAAFAWPDPIAIASAVADAFPVPNPFAEADPVADPVKTVLSIVYTTAPKTFEGPIAGYTTLTPIVHASPTPNNEEPTPTPVVKPDPSTKEAQNTPAIKSSSKIVAQTTLQTSTGLPSSLTAPTASFVPSLPLLAATTPLQSSKETSTASAASSTATSTVTKSAGLSPGGKAGLAIGILLLIGAVLALVLFFFKKRRNSLEQQQLDDEKTEAVAFAGAGRAASTRTTATAPRLSLRPVTQFLPNLGEKRQSRGNALALASTPPSANPQYHQNGPMGGQETARNNPFGNHAEVIDSANASGPPVVNDVGPGGEIVATSTTPAAVAGSTIGLARGTSKRVPNQLDFTKPGPFKGPPSPAGTEFSMSSEAATPAQSGSAAAIAAAGGPPNSTVHRVQLDFKPSMEDELELQAGQLIRLLHEYDDGWALCIRLDRSRQGVVPRTCLSTRPVKPRPQQNGPRGPPPPGMRVPGQQPRPMSPGMNQGPRPMSPAGNRAMTPNGQPSRPMTPNGQQGRPTTPQGRPMTPNGPKYNPQQQMTPNSQQGRPRSPSVAPMQDRRNSPPGPSPMNPSLRVGSPPGPSGVVTRKPVGQAM